jgi:hypothetical protein
MYVQNNNAVMQGKRWDRMYCEQEERCMLQEKERGAGAKPFLKSQPATTAPAPSTAVAPTATAAAPALVCSRCIMIFITWCYISQVALTLLHGPALVNVEAALLSRYESAHRYLRPASSSLLLPSQSLQL